MDAARAGSGSRAARSDHNRVTVCWAAGFEGSCQCVGIGFSITGTSASRTACRAAAARPGSSRCDQASAIMSACSAGRDHLAPPHRLTCGSRRKGRPAKTASPRPSAAKWAVSPSPRAGSARPGRTTAASSRVPDRTSLHIRSRGTLRPNVHGPKSVGRAVRGPARALGPLPPRAVQRDHLLVAKESFPLSCPAGGAADWAWPLAFAERACGCSARPVVTVGVPPVPGRAYPIDVLLPGHRYRASELVPLLAGATVRRAISRARRAVTGCGEAVGVASVTAAELPAWIGGRPWA